MEKRNLLEKLDAAKRDISEAESHLEKVLQAIQGAPRADKTTMSNVVKDAFAKLKAARGNLVDLEGLVENDKP
jgi:prefoldin subunit 5